MALQSTDIILVNRTSLTYKMPASEILTPIQSAQTTADSAKTQADANAAAIVNLQDNAIAVPPGVVFYTASQTVPEGYLPCDGALYSRITYPELYAAITYTYGGAGDNFRVPDLRSRFISGFDSSDARGYGSYQESANKSHFHSNDTTTEENNVNHTHTAVTTEAGNHQHQVDTYLVDASSDTVGTSGFWQNEQLENTSVAGAHVHPITVGENSVNHTHRLIFNTNSEGVEQGRPQNVNLYAIIRT